MTNGVRCGRVAGQERLLAAEQVAGGWSGCGHWTAWARRVEGGWKARLPHACLAAVRACTLSCTLSFMLSCTLSCTLSFSSKRALLTGKSQTALLPLLQSGYVYIFESPANLGCDAASSSSSGTAAAAAAASTDGLRAQQLLCAGLGGASPHWRMRPVSERRIE